MVCSLCLIKTEDAIAIDSYEGQKWKIFSLLEKYFAFCLSDNLNYGCVCRNCWSYIETFESFCARIEEIHQNQLTRSSQIVKTNGIGIDDLEILCEEPTYNLLESKSDDKDLIKNDLDIDVKDLCFIDGVQHLENAELLETSATTATTTVAKQAVNKKINKKETKETECEVCAVKLPTKFAYYKHYKRTHGKCIELNCNKTFSTPMKLNYHIIKRHSVPRINLHLKARQQLNETAICHLCGKSFRNEHTLKYHCEMVHTQDNKLQCDICKLWLKNKDTLKSHLLLHIQGPQPCDQCGKVLANRKSLRSHKRVHNEELRERHKCIVCGRGFRDKYKLKEHSYIHSGISDARQCEYCDRTFRFGSSYSAHRRKEHALEIEEQERAERELKVAPPNVLK